MNPFILAALTDLHLADYSPDNKLNYCCVHCCQTNPAVVHPFIVLLQVSALSGVLSKHGVTKGDRVLIYMPMIPQAVVAMLATVRLGAIHSLVFGGFASKELSVRINHAQVNIYNSGMHFKWDNNIMFNNNAITDEKNAVFQLFFSNSYYIKRRFIYHHISLLTFF